MSEENSVGTPESPGAHTSVGEDLAASSLPPFLTKLYQLVDSPSAKHIEWGAEGNTFVITNPTLFARDLLPLYFKHNSLPSFTRQLLTYGFKRCHASSGTGQSLEFKHAYFMKGDRAALRLIRRRVAAKKVGGDMGVAGACDQGRFTPLHQALAHGDRDQVFSAQLHHLREYVGAVEHTLVKSLAEIKERLAEMEAHAYGGIKVHSHAQPGSMDLPPHAGHGHPPVQVTLPGHHHHQPLALAAPPPGQPSMVPSYMASQQQMPHQGHVHMQQPQPQMLPPASMHHSAASTVQHHMQQPVYGQHPPASQPMLFMQAQTMAPPAPSLTHPGHPQANGHAHHMAIPPPNAAYAA